MNKVHEHSILQSLRALCRSKMQQSRERYNRVLPFGEVVVDRWEKARLLGFGENASIYDSAIVYGSVHVGAHSWIGPQVILDGSAAPVCIGAWCSISAAVHVYTHDSVAWAVSGGKAAYPSASVHVGDNVYIGPMSIIAKGVTIDEGCIIGAHSFVNSNIPAHSAAWGTPARVMGKVVVRNDEDGYDIVPLHETDRNEAIPCVE